MGKEKQYKRLNELYNKTLDSDFKYDGKLNNIDYFSAICKATSNDQMIKFKGSNLFLFNYRYNNKDSILMIFAIPLSSDNNDNKPKHITERIMGIIQILEEFFITLDYTECKQVKEEKFSYLTVVKHIEKQKNEEENNNE